MKYLTPMHLFYKNLSLLLLLPFTSVFAQQSNAEWITFCKKYSQYRKECAVASKFSSCMDIKWGSQQWNLGRTYCAADGTPEWFLMGRKAPSS